MAHGDTRIIPLELQESMLPFRIEEFALREDSAGAGKFRGGLGFRKTYRMLAPCNLGTNLDRTLCPPWGVQGGKAAKPGRFTVVEGRDGQGRSASTRRTPIRSSPATWSASRPAAAAAMGRRRSGRSI